MKRVEISSAIAAKIPHELTSGQQYLVTVLGRFICSKVESPILLLKGYAGTGKTTVLSAFVKASKQFNLKTELLAPTGRAAKVLSNYSGQKAHTIHRIIYIPASKNEVISLVSKRNKQTNTTFIVDEASMIGVGTNGQNSSHFAERDLLDDLIAYIFSQPKNRLILIGDTAQLPPVGLDISPALDQNYLKSSYPVTVGSCFLDEVVRQSERSGILKNATRIRQKIDQEEFTPPYFLDEQNSDFQRLNGMDFLDELQNAYSRSGIENCAIICRSNKRAYLYNQQIRNRILMREEILAAEDLVMVVKNNYFWLEEDSPAGFIANGEIGEVLQVRRIEEQYGFKFADIHLRLIDYPDMEAIELKVLLNTLDAESASLSFDDYRTLYKLVEEDYMHIANKQKRRKAIHEDPYLNALQIKFAYALTCHKTQGGQWDTIFIDQGYIVEDMINRSFMRWLYTAITRATEKAWLVNFNNYFFEENENE